MIFKAYLRRDGAFVLVPDCLVASREAELRHGPLRYVGHVDASRHEEPQVWDRVLADIDHQSYSVVRSSIAPSLVPDEARLLATA